MLSELKEEANKHNLDKTALQKQSCTFTINLWNSKGLIEN